jgi:hypothetical protein
MNALTKNRIIEPGDEYLIDGHWKPVTEKLIGLQVMFSGLTQVRRPSETISSLDGDKLALDAARKFAAERSKPISPDSGERPAAKAEKEKTPVPTPSGTGDHSSSYLPTVVSHKAHSEGTIPAGPIEKAIEKAKASASVSQSKEVRFPASKYCYPIWTGRNGTFDCKAINLHRIKELIAIVPQGKRGAGNCIIEFPVAVIPEIVEWLKEQQDK